MYPGDFFDIDREIASDILIFGYNGLEYLDLLGEGSFFVYAAQNLSAPTYIGGDIVLHI